MLTKSEKRKLAAKEKEWDIVLHDFNIVCGKIWKEVKLDFKNMINWLLFYKSTSKGDKILHIIEVFVIWILITKTIYGW